MTYCKATTKICSFLLTLLLLLGSSLVSSESLYIYAGAGLKPALDILAARFEQREGVTIRIDYGGSGQILSRFQASHRGDLFIPGSKVHFAALNGSDELLSIHNLVMHTPVVGIFPDKKDLIQDFSDLSKQGIKVGVGDPKSMALGRTAEHILKNSPLESAIRNNIVVQAATVKQLTLYVLKGNIDAAIIGRSDVMQNQGKLKMIAIPPAWYKPEIIAVGVLSTTKLPDLANRFASLLSSQEGIDIFIKLGFLPYQKEPKLNDKDK
ncbi:molybdate ABC transporter substrate-binding protein [Psychromonas sp. PT13]|uniref:molybdate ABC transporter substrate-binding protein n=1 Tax=Psychromonas sp. PT13 TaxID=3439547 RepID=UPI003EBEF476